MAEHYYNIMVVDDEFFIREGLMSYEWEKLGFQAVCSAKNGKKALEHLEDKDIDLIIADIKMPVMNGLEMSKIVREKYPHIIVIILSGYKEFNYAREAVKNQVYDYLLKPFNFKDLQKLFKKVKKELNSKRKELQKLKTYKKQIQETLPIARNQFLKDLVEGKITDYEEVKEKTDLLELNLNKDYLNCTIINFHKIFDLKITIKLSDYLLSNNLGELLIQSEQQVLLILTPTKNSRSLLEKQINRIIDILDDHLSEDDTNNFTLAVGRICKNILSLADSYQDALSLVQKYLYHQAKRVNYIYNEENIKESTNNYPYSQENRLLNSIMEGNKKESLKNFLTYWQSISKSKKYSITAIKKNIVQFLNILEHRLINHDISLEKNYNIIPPFTTFIRNLETLTDIENKLRDLIIKVVKLTAKVNNKTAQSSYPAIHKAIKYIRDNYNKKITLNEVADNVYLNPSYLSVLFKQETGQNFIDYLSNYRLAKAKELLKRLDLKIYQVGDLVGYKNPKYFTEIFKKNTGLTPNEYRKSNL